MKLLAKLKKGISTNKQLFIGLSISVLVMLPMGLYISERNANRQATNQPNATQKPTDSSNLQSLTPATEQSNTQGQGSSQPSESNTSKPSNASSQNSTTTQPYKSPVCTEKPIPYETSYKEASDLYPSQSYTGLDGRNGSITTCTADSLGYKPKDITYSPGTRSVWVGTKTNSPIQPTSELASQRARSECIPVANKYGYGSGGDTLCIQAITTKLLGN